MSLFTDRRGGQRKMYDLGTNTPPTHDPSQGLAGWASAHHDANVGLAATMTTAQRPVAARTVLPGQQGSFAPPTQLRSRPTDFNPSIQSPAEARANMRPAGVGSRIHAWSGGSMPASQTVTPGMPMKASRRAAQTVLPQVAKGPSFAQRIVGSSKARIMKGRA